MNLDRFERAISAFVREMFPTLDYMGLYDYSVVSFDTGAQLADLAPVKQVGLPELSQVPLRSWGVKVNLKSGTSVLVGFENHDPARPYVANFDRLGSAAFLPDRTSIDATNEIDLGTASSFVGRIGDNVNGGYIVLAHTPAGTFVSAAYFPGTTAGQLAATAAAAAIGTSGNVPTIVDMSAGGKITEGSDKVKA